MQYLPKVSIANVKTMDTPVKLLRTLGKHENMPYKYKYISKKLVLFTVMDHREIPHINLNH